MMKISTKIRYGVRLLCDISYNSGGIPAQVKQVSKRQEISARYIEQIFQKLKKAGIIQSVRGPFGGYLLAKKPEEITVGDIIRAIDGKDIQLVFCAGYPKGSKKPCKRFGKCVVSDVWDGASQTLMNYFNTITISQLCAKAKKKEGGV
jgi:Rrf2 family transcriptional regulator, iron-sulfur cluster assembly transcription factor